MDIKSDTKVVRCECGTERLEMAPVYGVIVSNTQLAMPPLGDAIEALIGSVVLERIAAEPPAAPDLAGKLAATRCHVLTIPVAPLDTEEIVVAKARAAFMASVAAESGGKGGK